MTDVATTTIPPEDGVDAQKAAILTAAVGLFTRYGFAKTTISEIARDCGMSPANLYRYFRNKQAIGCAVAGRYMAGIDCVCAAAAAGAGPGAEARLRAIVLAHVRHTVARLRETPKMVELAEMVVRDDEGRALLARHVAHREALAREIIAEGMASGEFGTQDAARAAKGFLHGLKFFFAPFALARHGLDSVEDDLAATLDLLCAGLRAR
jgi:AcrR family transcriptional regulator